MSRYLNEMLMRVMKTYYLYTTENITEFTFHINTSISLCLKNNTDTLVQTKSPEVEKVENKRY